MLTILLLITKAESNTCRSSSTVYHVQIQTILENIFQFFVIFQDLNTNHDIQNGCLFCSKLLQAELFLAFKSRRSPY